ncbi:hypothetical protein CC1G_13841 [Coprinopsis cinerea okayama7|uniref:Uncharacterized protein n=1 Tax=Coprinopsis cinerea (strain Okayama-7 / 130 / ATCC MYA-4618 / FGSC 9003) TaxID=240176 RepID=D6RKK3_COPC7|nr:hypothetical protein CC1G_13841 [Coprinopsis cinerea okayama7\|eukprot:XP_002911806.1 hypothetical protein CC1G_13841 [Coprinopsis cinerea okayama7\
MADVVDVNPIRKTRCRLGASTRRTASANLSTTSRTFSIYVKSSDNPELEGTHKRSLKGPKGSSNATDVVSSASRGVNQPTVLCSLIDLKSWVLKAFAVSAPQWGEIQSKTGMLNEKLHHLEAFQAALLWGMDSPECGSRQRKGSGTNCDGASIDRTYGGNAEEIRKGVQVQITAFRTRIIGSLSARLAAEFGREKRREGST